MDCKLLNVRGLLCQGLVVWACGLCYTEKNKGEVRYGNLCCILIKKKQGGCIDDGTEMDGRAEPGNKEA